MPSYCTKCHITYEKGNFCTKCGTKLSVIENSLQQIRDAAEAKRKLEEADLLRYFLNSNYFRWFNNSNTSGANKKKIDCEKKTENEKKQQKNNGALFPSSFSNSNRRQQEAARLSSIEKRKREEELARYLLSSVFSSHF